jgi:hypothetical protein
MQAASDLTWKASSTVFTLLLLYSTGTTWALLLRGGCSAAARAAAV